MHCSGGPRVLMCPLSPQWGNTDKRWGSPWGGWGPHAGAGRTDPLWPHTGGSPKSPQRGVPTPRGHNGAHPIEGGAAAALHKCAEQKVCQWDRRVAWARRADGRTDRWTWGQSPPRSRADGRPVPLHNDGQQWQRAQNWATNIYSGRRANTAPGQFNCGMGSVVLTLFFFFPPFFLLFFLFFSSVLLPGQVKSLFPPPLKKAFSTPARCSWGAGTGTDPMGKLRHEGGRQR